MTNSVPTGAELRDKRMELGFTQAKCAEMVRVNRYTWQQWESGRRTMHPAFWELFTIKLSRIRKK